MVTYNDGEAGVRRFIRFHAASGTVAIAPTTATAPPEAIERALADIERVRTSAPIWKDRSTRRSAR